ncbi:pilus assembly protein TadG-related protein [Jannaschia seohaensis]|uniref:Flp pilus assembly protein TadG n=1 Tax=Jannaschia seohaensis TaxID=475081 RepID=A0A2Y9C0P8_9RHOB|nr:pilus assembly protein TadG-related protein [Jannaschia seohaensis]PWJ18087.1 Flp pilus assembly protein TadG [Jannaschia seohaensis]SSA46612.1 Flp pilus assembly protein TadG [Jannaschia seohaensis]
MIRAFRPSKRSRRAFATDESGGITVFGLFLFMACCGMAGLALDVSHAFLTRTKLQAAADSAAHAALVARQTQTETEAAQIALDVVERSLPAAANGQVITTDDVVFGLWDETLRTFVASTGAKDAVMVDTARIEARGNPVGAFLLRIVGQDSFSVLRKSVAYTFEPRCMLEGFVGEEYVDVTSNNYYTQGFCIHSNGYVEVSSNNTYEEGVIVSMPDRNDIVLPSSGWESNDGLREAMRDSYYEINAAERVAIMRAGLTDPTSPIYPDYLTTHFPVTLSWQSVIDETTWQPGRIHEVTCNSSNQRVRVAGGTVLRRGVLITNCEVAFGADAAAEDVNLVTTSPSLDSITGASGIRMGLDDDCAPGGGAQFFTLGGMRVPASFRIFGSRVIAGGPVSFVADTGGIDGAHVVSDAYVSATAGGTIGFCGVEGLPEWYKQRYYRIVF